MCHHCAAQSCMFSSHGSPYLSADQMPVHNICIYLGCRAAPQEGLPSQVSARRGFFERDVFDSSMGPCTLCHTLNTFSLAWYLWYVHRYRVVFLPLIGRYSGRHFHVGGIFSS